MQAVYDVAAGVVGAVVGAVGGFLVGGPGGAVVGGIAGAAEGVSLSEQQHAAQTAHDQAVANAGPSNPSNPAPVNTGGAGTTATDPTTQATNASTIAAERYAEAETSIGSMQSQLDTAVLGEKVSEIQSEGSITASAASRGLKMEGSPLMQLIAQKNAGASGIAYTEQQGTASISGAQTGAQSGFDAAMLARKENLQYADQQLSNAWLSSFSQAINFGTSMMKGWTPDAISTSGVTTGGPQGDESGIDYFGY